MQVTGGNHHAGAYKDTDTTVVVDGSTRFNRRGHQPASRFPRSRKVRRRPHLQPSNFGAAVASGSRSLSRQPILRRFGRVAVRMIERSPLHLSS